MLFRMFAVRLYLTGHISEPIRITEGMRPDCVLHLILYNMYQTNIKENKQIEKKLEIQLARNRIISTVLYADSRQVISESEEVLQIQHTS